MSERNLIFCQNRFIERFVVLWANECLSEKCKWSCCLVFRSFMSFPWTDRDKNYNDGVLFITCSSDLAGDIPAHSDKSRISRISSCCKPKLSVFFSQIFRFLHTRQYRPTISPHNTCTFSSLKTVRLFAGNFRQNENWNRSWIELIRTSFFHLKNLQRKKCHWLFGSNFRWVSS